ncbi:flagellar motor protein MotB [Halomonas koreensis]|uniref:Flagellar motor protein MotB n=1 Tax=Halomonas koreensis TaxID=245385 RepID=A0ABU1G529_9GAMM|nr:flagellar motor protein MotB [Halomonas koreensis]MDR5867529.1 flagellar motor protein MotB [Halomonas koreensis]
MDEAPEPKKPGAAAWMVTYADLMSLLMCFFVMLLSFAEIDAERFKRLAGELSRAFGVQRDVPAEQIPMGTSPAFDQFSPGRPQPTPLERMQQSTTEARPRLDTFRGEERDRRLMAVAREVDALLTEASAQGQVKVETEARRVVVRIQERSTFPSGAARVLPPFAALLGEMSSVLSEVPGIIEVDGHTDDVPIRGSRYASNWDLSAARASSVANLLLEDGRLDPERLVVRGFADTRPLTANETPEGRARNRRVEITINLADAPRAAEAVNLQQLSRR